LKKVKNEKTQEKLNLNKKEEISTEKYVKGKNPRGRDVKRKNNNTWSEAALVQP